MTAAHDVFVNLADRALAEGLDTIGVLATLARARDLVSFPPLAEPTPGLLTPTRVTDPEPPRAKKKPRAERLAAEKGDKPIGKREAQRAQIRELHADGKTPAQIAKVLKVTETALRQRLKKMGLSDAGASPAATATASGAVTPFDLVKFLKEIGANVIATRTDGGYELEGKPTDVIGLLEQANAWRRRNKQPLLTLKRG